MSGDWLKMELSTPDKPEVWFIANELSIDPDAVVGKLFRVWSWFDQHSEEGNAPSVSKMLLDRLVSVSNFCDSMIKAGWMGEEDGVLTLPNFDRHNGKTGKSRSLTAKRVASHKAKTQKKQKSNAPSVSDALPREEKRREEKSSNKKSKPKKANAFTPPTIEQVYEYAISRKANHIAQPFFDFYDAGDWKDSHNNQVNNWKQKFITWQNREEKQNETSGKSNRPIANESHHAKITRLVHEAC